MNLPTTIETFSPGCILVLYKPEIHYEEPIIFSIKM